MFIILLINIYNLNFFSFEKHTQEYQGKIWIRSLTTIAPMGKERYKGQQLQGSQDIYFKVHRTKLNTS